MKLSILIFFNILSVTTSFGQITFKQNTIFLEAGGNGLFGSINYERLLTGEPGIGMHIGVGFYSENAFYLTIPVGINYLFKLKNPNEFIDAGLGVTLVRENAILFGSPKNVDRGHFVSFVPSIGYRKHVGESLMWRVSFTPVANKFNFVPWLGLSIGKRF